MDEQQIRTRLAALRHDVGLRLQTLAAELRAVADASTGSNLDDEHDPEGATIAFERAQLTSLHAQAARELAEVDLAGRRVDEGSYGLCSSCGSAVGDERLAARPATRRCVRCAATGGRRGCAMMRP